MERNFVFALPEDSKAFLESFVNRSNVLSGFIKERCILPGGSRIQYGPLCGIRGLLRTEWAGGTLTQPVP